MTDDHEGFNAWGATEPDQNVVVEGLEVVGGHWRKKEPRVLRIDDIGASSKKWERHRGKLFAYRELRATELDDLHRWLQRTKNRATLAITACWVERNGSLTRYDVKFPEQTGAIRRMVQAGLVEIACHGLTHCIPGRHRATWWPLRGNRRWHREFTDDLPISSQQDHLVRSKEFLERAFTCDVTTLVPPGNAISAEMATYAGRQGFQVITLRNPIIARIRYDTPQPDGCEGYDVRGVPARDDHDDLVLHDRDLVGYGRVAKVLRPLEGTKWVTVREGAR